MKLKETIKEYWQVFWADSSKEDQVRLSRNNLQYSLMILSGFCFVLALINALRGQYRMTVSTLVLCVLFVVTFLMMKLAGKYQTPLTLCILGLEAILSYYVITGENNGFAALWTLMAPLFVMLIIGVRSGMLVGVYFQVLLTVLFWTPLRSLMEIHYTENFLDRFPLLYLCGLVISGSAMLAHKKQRMALDAYQDKLEDAVQAEHNKVRMIAFETVGAITSLVDAKDAYTDDHSLRVAHYSLVIAEEMGWSQQASEDLYYSALLHDIGKVGVHDAILKKNGRLTDNEYAIMKTHTSIGATILKEMSFLESADEGALYHHEKYDGTGYPFGLMGEAIPKNARIICLADSFDAMNSARVYRAKCSKEYILDEIRRCRGTQFDPEVVDAFFRCIEKNKIRMDFL